MQFLKLKDRQLLEKANTCSVEKKRKISWCYEKHKRCGENGNINIPIGWFMYGVSSKSFLLWFLCLIAAKFVQRMISKVTEASILNCYRCYWLEYSCDYPPVGQRHVILSLIDAHYKWPQNKIYSHVS